MVRLLAIIRRRRALPQRGVYRSPSCALAVLGVLLVGRPAAAQIQPCPAEADCAAISSVAPAGPVVRGDVFNVAVDLQPGAEDGIAGGLDDLAALTFSLGVPGLDLADCSNPTKDGLTPAISPAASIVAPLRLVIENTTCDANPDRPCLCPSAGQMRADYVNIAVFGPRIQAGQNPADVKTLPAGELVTLALRARAGAVSPMLLHVYAATDSPAQSPKPPFGAQASLGDFNGVDVSSAAGVSRIRTTDGSVIIVEPATPTRTATITVTPLISSTPTRTGTGTVTVTPQGSPTSTRTGTVTPQASPTSTPPGTGTVPPTATPTAVEPTGTRTSPEATHTPTPPLATETPTVPSATSTPAEPTVTGTRPVPTATATRTNTAPPESTPTALPCTGDCDNSGSVGVEEIRIGVRLALGEVVPDCSAFDVDHDGTVTIEELVAGVRAKRDGCP